MAPASMTFLAGLFAGAGINMLTSVATGPVSTSTTKIIVDASLWVVAAGCVTWAAHLSDTADRAAEHEFTPDLGETERAGIRREEHARNRGRLTILSGAAIGCVLLAVVLLLV